MNLPTQDTCFQNWLASQSDNDLRSALAEDVGELIKGRVRREIEGCGVDADILHFTRPNLPMPLVDTNLRRDQNR